jgi:hypothetical protein
MGFDGIGWETADFRGFPVDRIATVPALFLLLHLVDKSVA